MTALRILVATDFSAHSGRALAVARAVGGPGARYRLLHVVPPVAEPLFAGREHTRTREAAAEGRRDARKRLREDADRLDAKHADARLVEGPVGPAVAKAARAFRADLVAVGTGKESAVQRFLLGSKARSILRTVDVSVLIARGRSPRRRSAAPRRIVVATDFHEPSRAAARAARDVARRTRAHVSLVHVVEPLVWSYAVAAQRRGGDPEAESRFLHQVGVALHRFNRDALGGRGREVLLRGHPVEATLDLVRSSRADLLVAGSHGPGAIERWMLGSVGHDLAVDAPCSVWIERPRPARARKAQKRRSR